LSSGADHDHTGRTGSERAASLVPGARAATRTSRAATRTSTAGQAPAQPPYAQQPDPFAPVARAPKTPWIAPQRKPAVIAIAIAAAVVLLLVGGVSGWAIFDTGNGHPTRNVQFDRPGFGNGPRMFPRGPDGNGRRVIPRIPGTPTPSPSTTS
jgi:hypothetical protein